MGSLKKSASSENNLKVDQVDSLILAIRKWLWETQILSFSVFALIKSSLLIIIKLEADVSHSCSLRALKLTPFNTKKKKNFLKS